MKKITLIACFTFLLFSYCSYGQVFAECKSHSTFLLDYEKDYEYGLNYVEKYAIDFNSGSIDVDGNELAFTFSAKPVLANTKVVIDNVEYIIDNSISYFFDETGFLGFDGDGLDYPMAKADIKEKFHTGKIEKWLPEYRSSVKRLVCEDLKHVEELEINLNVWNTNLESDVCTGNLIFIGGNDCPAILIDRKLIGSVTNLKGDGVPDVKVGLRKGSQYKQWFTNVNGDFDITPPLKLIYDIEVRKKALPLDGVSTLDLVLVLRHILGIEKLDDIQLYAADYNSDFRVRTNDIVALQKVLLGINIDEETSLTMVPEDLAFGEVTNPFLDMSFVFDATSSMNSYRNYIAIKKGDVNGSSRYDSVNGEKIATERTDDDIVFFIQNERLSEGEKRIVSVNMDTENNLVGLQFSLVTQDIEVLGLTSKLPGFTNANWSLHQDTLVVSWVNESGVAITINEGEIFELSIKAKADIELEKSLRISLLPLEPQAYKDDDLEVYKIELIYIESDVHKNEFSVKQNHPNPFNEHTVLEIYSPEHGEVMIEIFDNKGMLLLKQTHLVWKGLNSVSISLDEIGIGNKFSHYYLNNWFENHGQTILYCKITQKDKTILKKMIHIK